jgi:hypothetical protein
VKHLTALFLLASLTPAAEAQTPDAGHAHHTATQAVALDFGSLDARLTAAEQSIRDLQARVDGLFFSGGQGGAAYAEARRRALAENKPLVVWVGGGDALCPACMHTLGGEAVHHVAESFPDTPASALVVAVPEGGDLFRVATITRWVTGDPTWGHVPSVRRALRNWRERRVTTEGGWSLDAPTAPPAPARGVSMASWGGMGGGMRTGPLRRTARGGCSS